MSAMINDDKKDGLARILVGPPNETLLSIIPFLDSTDLSNLSRVNRSLHDDSHPLWYCLARSICKMPIQIEDTKAETKDVDWKKAVATAIYPSMDPFQYKDILNNHIVALGALSREAKTNFEAQTEWIPELYVPAAGMNLKVPLDPAQLRELIDGGYCGEAPVGRGSETIVDVDIRRGKRLMLGTDVLVGNHSDGSGFPASTGLDVQSILHRVQEELVPHLFTGGGGKVWAQPYSMLIYEKGDFFKPHRDTLRGKHHFGSLSVMLPVQGGCEGGQFVLTHGSCASDDTLKTTVVEPPGRDSPVVKYVAFFTDLFHQVYPITSGYRVSLTYHLWAVPSSDPTVLSVPRMIDSVEQTMLRKILAYGLKKHFAKWGNKSHRFVFPLDHKYSGNTLRHLRGRDLEHFNCFSFEQTEEEEESSISITLETLDVEPFEKPDDPTKYKHLDLVEVDESKLDTERLSEATLWMNQERFLAMIHYHHSYEYYTGNEGYSTDFMYQHACIIIAPSEFEIKSGWYE